jgi:hypothetical protein
MASIETFHYPGLHPVERTPKGWHLDESDVYDRKKHLQLEPPTHVKDLEFRTLPFPYSVEEKAKKRGFAYSKPFRCLSAEGVRAARASVDNARETYPGEIGKGNARATHFARGVGYTSKWMRDFTYDTAMTDLLSDLARDELWPHTMTMSVGHTNVGKPATGKPVDKWHVDSTDYVLVVIISDIAEMEGGMLRVLQQPDSSGSYFQELQMEGVPEDLIETVKYTGPGYGIFMHGSKILHCVTPVLKAREPRYSLVNSYMTTNVFLKDPTKYHTFTKKGFDDRMDVVPLEFARHKAWRAKGQMSYLTDHAPFGSTPEVLAKILADAGGELIQASRLLMGQEHDNASFVGDEAEKKKALAVVAEKKQQQHPVVVRARL